MVFGYGYFASPVSSIGAVCDYNLALPPSVNSATRLVCDFQEFKRCVAMNGLDGLHLATAQIVGEFENTEYVGYRCEKYVPEVVCNR